MIHAGAGGESKAIATPISARDDAIYPQAFSTDSRGFSPGVDVYLREPNAARMAHFFQAKGVSAIKEEDFSEKWYDDWLAYQAAHRLYASVLSPKEFSATGGELVIPSTIPRPKNVRPSTATGMVSAPVFAL